MRASFALLAVVASFALLAVGCGGDDEASGDPTVAWAESFCGSVETLRSELEAIGESVGDPSSLSLDSLGEAADDASAAVDTFVEDVQDLGGPELEAGDEIESSVQTLTDTIEAEKAEVEDAVEDAEGITGVTSAISTIAGSVSTMVSSFQSVLTELGQADTSGELERAFDEAESCSAIRD